MSFCLRVGQARLLHIFSLAFLVLCNRQVVVFFIWCFFAFLSSYVTYNLSLVSCLWPPYVLVPLLFSLLPVLLPVQHFVSLALIKILRRVLLLGCFQDQFSFCAVVSLMIHRCKHSRCNLYFLIRNKASLLVFTAFPFFLLWGILCLVSFLSVLHRLSSHTPFSTRDVAVFKSILYIIINNWNALQSILKLIH